MYVSLYVCGFVACRALIEFTKTEYDYESKRSNVPCEEEEKLPRCAWTFNTIFTKMGELQDIESIRYVSDAS